MQDMIELKNKVSDNDNKLKLNMLVGKNLSNRSENIISMFTSHMFLDSEFDKIVYINSNNSAEDTNTRVLKLLSKSTQHINFPIASYSTSKDLNKEVHFRSELTHKHFSILNIDTINDDLYDCIAGYENPIVYIHDKNKLKDYMNIFKLLDYAHVTVATTLRS